MTDLKDSAQQLGNTIDSQQVWIEKYKATNAELLDALETARRKVGAVWVVCDTGSDKEKVLDEALAVINKAISKAKPHADTLKGE